MTYYRHIGLIGKAGSGKDTVARRLTQRFAFTRVAFADPLKEAAFELNPIVGTDTDSFAYEGERLRDVVEYWGWDSAKRNVPEVRRILQRVGQTVRTLDPDFWVRVAVAKIDVAERWNLPVVVTDVRYENEARALRGRGFDLVRVVRPGASAGGDAAAHGSETELDNWATRYTVSNTGDLESLYRQVDALPRH